MKHTTVLDGSAFEGLMRKAESLLRTVEKLPHMQAIVLETDEGNEYGAVIADALSAECADERALVVRLAEAKDVTVKRLLCLWADGGVDLPSMAFRRMLCELSAENGNAVILLKAENGYTVKQMGVTMK